MRKLKARPIAIREANSWVAQFHRHNRKTRGGLFAIRAEDETGKSVGIAIAGRPIARLSDNGKTVEILRVVTDGTENANSFLYAACWRIAQAMGYEKVITYTLKSESGASLRAVGWRRKEIKGGSWNGKNRRRAVQLVQLQDKYRWTKEIREAV